MNPVPGGGTEEDSGSGRSRDDASARAGRFALVGVANTLIDFLLYGVLSLAGVGFLLANFVSTTAGMTFGFFAHRAFSFRSTTRVRDTVIPFVLTTGVGLWVVQPLVIWAVRSLLTPWLGESALTEVWAPKAAAIGVGMVWNFLLYHLVVFRRKGPLEH